MLKYLKVKKLKKWYIQIFYMTTFERNNYTNLFLKGWLDKYYSFK